MKTRNILLIVEGKITEVEMFEKLGQLFLDKRTQLKFFVYKSNIYSLYHKIKEYDEFTDTISILKDLATNSKDKAVLNGKFSEIYLVFDYDPQETAYSDEKIMEMVNLFSDETEFGKLYINYPMMESYKDHKNFDLSEFVSKRVDLENLSSESYKAYIEENGYKRSIDKYTQRHFKLLCKINACKTNYILNQKIKFPTKQEYEVFLEQKWILEMQIDSKNSEGSFYVLNTSSMFLLDYFGDKYYREISAIK